MVWSRLKVPAPLPASWVAVRKFLHTSTVGFLIPKKGTESGDFLQSRFTTLVLPVASALI